MAKAHVAVTVKTAQALKFATKNNFLKQLLDFRSNTEKRSQLSETFFPVHYYFISLIIESA